MTHMHAMTIRAPWLVRGTPRPAAAPRARDRSHTPLLSARPRRAIGAGMTLAGTGTVAASAAGFAAQPTAAGALHLLIATAATVTVAHCATTAWTDEQ